jgi:hypothetical protein
MIPDNFLDAVSGTLNSWSLATHPIYCSPYTHQAGAITPPSVLEK